MPPKFEEYVFIFSKFNPTGLVLGASVEKIWFGNEPERTVATLVDFSGLLQYIRRQDF